MRWLPRSMAGQLLTLLLLAVVTAHVIAVVMQEHSYADARIHPLSMREIENRIAVAYRVATAEDMVPDSLFQALNAPDAYFHVTTMTYSDGEDMIPQEEQLMNNIRKRLHLPAEVPVRVYLHKVDPQRSPGKDRESRWLSRVLAADNAWALDVELGLPGGQALASRHWPAILGGHWWRVLSFSLPVSVLPIIFIAFFFGRRIMRPLKALTKAAERVSRGERVALLPLEGPDGVSPDFSPVGLWR